MAALARRWGFFRQIAATEAPPGFDPQSRALPLVFKRWATKKAGGSTDNGKDSKPKYLGLKKCGGQRVIPGNIIVRQRGTRFHPGDFVGMGRDRTIYALIEGTVRFEKNVKTKRQWIHVDPKNPPPLHPLFRKPDEEPAKPKPRKVRPDSKKARMYWWKQATDTGPREPVGPRPLPALCLMDPSTPPDFGPNGPLKPWTRKVRLAAVRRQKIWCREQNAKKKLEASAAAKLGKGGGGGGGGGADEKSTKQDEVPVPGS